MTVSPGSILRKETVAVSAPKILFCKLEKDASSGQAKPHASAYALASRAEAGFQPSFLVLARASLCSQPPTHPSVAQRSGGGERSRQRIRKATQKEAETEKETENETEREGGRKKAREGKTEGRGGERHRSDSYTEKGNKWEGARCFGLVSPRPVPGCW